MIVADLSPGELRRQLNRSGLRIRIGPVVAAVRSAFRSVEASIALHYASHPLASETDFADFHISVETPAGVRRWVKPQALFRFDGTPPFKPLAAEQAFPLLEWGLNWCVSAHCHQYLIIHAAVVERDGRALVLPAPPGSGKSTLCAALVARGWRLFSDELALVDIAHGHLVPMPRPISLKNQSIEVIARFWGDASMSPVVHDTLKGSVAHVRPPPTSVHRSSETAVPGWIVLPRYHAGHPTELLRLSKAMTFMRIVESAFNYSIHGRRGFDVVTRLVAASGCFEFSYGGALEEAVRKFDELDEAS